jgi:uncharacterized protein (DUF488 family)
VSGRPIVWTVGHSTLQPAELLALLRGAGVGAIADVRRHPGSRRLPWFNADALRETLHAEGLGYAHLPALGGRRTRHPGSGNGGWENASFQGYADHMETPEFAEGLDHLEALARQAPTAVMCAEAPWWRCHRRMIADAMLAAGWEVLHVMPGGRTTEHELTPFAVRGEDGRLRYPPQQLSLG